VSSVIRSALPIDGEIIILSQIMAFAVAIPTAMRSARKPDGIVDRFLGATSFTLLSIPPYILIIVMVLFISIKLGVSGTGPSAYVSFGTDWITNLEASRYRPSRWPRAVSWSTTACCAATSSRPCKKSSSHGALQRTQSAPHHVAPRLSPVLGGPARGGQRQHRRLLAPGSSCNICCRYRVSATR